MVCAALDPFVFFRNPAADVQLARLRIEFDSRDPDEEVGMYARGGRAACCRLGDYSTDG